MNRISICCLLPLAAGILAVGAGAAEAQDSLEVYLPVLEQLRESYANAPVYLFTSRLRIECVRGGCDEPRVGSLPEEWLSAVRGQGLIRGSCRYDRGMCAGPDGTALVDRRGAYAMLGTSRACGEECMETLIEVTAGEEKGLVRRTTSYRLTRAEGKWRVESTTPIGWSIID
jgi:hypothetical protein